MKNLIIGLLMCVLIFMTGCKSESSSSNENGPSQDSPAETKSPVENPADAAGDENVDTVKSEQNMPNPNADENPAGMEKVDKEEVKVGIGMTAPPLEGLTFVKGEPVKMTKGHIYVVEFWATWCPPCLKSIPHLTRLQQDYSDKNVTIIGISKETVDKVKPFVEKQGDQMDYVVAVDKALEVDKNYMQAFNVRGIPNAFIVDHNGIIVWQGHPMAMDVVLAEVVAGNFDPVAFEQKQKEQQSLQKKMSLLLQQYSIEAMVDSETPTEKSRKLASEFIEAAPSQWLNYFAMLIMKHEKLSFRDHEMALKAVQKAYEMTDGKDLEVLNTYALALYQNGKVADAISHQQKLMKMCQNQPQEIIDEVQKQMDMFKNVAAEVTP